ncbi:hypothetical protein FHS25_005188 [Rhizobium laguerreae]|uniref:Uncharacterized protein n=1 Tax=Rhizobium laguerreae TaxID=1076926 RepID=A0ABR6GEH1_9HYPH|nr:hypothetical protein [Rhizobium laguerreae]MBB3164685.1 hypothetical protein [Rhizobium laguerreae]
MTKLTRDFEKWRRARRRELIDLGIPSSAAHAASKDEAFSRQAMVAIVGKDAALTSKTMVKLRPDGTCSMLLVTPECKIPPQLRNRAEAWAAAPDRPKAGSPAN